MYRVKYVGGGTKREAWEACPWASVIARMRGGWMAFEVVSDYMAWRHRN